MPFSTLTFFTIEEVVRRIRAGLLTRVHPTLSSLPGHRASGSTRDFVPLTVACPFPILRAPCQGVRTTGFPLDPLKPLTRRGPGYLYTYKNKPLIDTLLGTRCQGVKGAVGGERYECLNKRAWQRSLGSAAHLRVLLFSCIVGFRLRSTQPTRLDFVP
jgi:hypothetical protein